MEEAFDGAWEVGDDGLHLALLCSALCSPDGGAPMAVVGPMVRPMVSLMTA